MSLRKKFQRNIIYAFGAQSVSMLMSLTMSLVVPKFLDVTNFGYWQLFIFYYSYIGFFHLGLNDGVYLKYGGIEYDNLDKNAIGSQFKLSAVFQCSIAFIISVITYLCVDESNRQFIIYATALCMVIENSALYLGYVFQASNETKLFSISVIIDKVLFLASLVLLLFIKTENFKFYVCLYLFSKTVSLIYCIYKGRDIVFAGNIGLKKTAVEALDNVKIGINLMLANIASTLIIGAARFMVDGKWGIETFGQFSLSISMINFVLLFLGQVSMVLFPMLRQVDDKKRMEMYVSIRDALTIILPVAFVAYVPVGCLISIWLPQYKSSVEYLGILLPICTYNGKMNLLCNTYYKVLRKEKKLLQVNILTMALSVLLSGIAVYVFDSIILVAISIVLAIAFRSWMSEIYIAKIMNSSICRNLCLETLMVISFMLIVWYTSGIVAFTLILISYAVYLLFNKNKLKLLKRMKMSK